MNVWMATSMIEWMEELLVASEHEQVSMNVWMATSMIEWMDVHRATSCK
jgi:hypothetical protein